MTGKPVPGSTTPMERDVGLTEPGISVVEVPLVRATQGSLEGFARVERSFADALVEIVTWPAQGWRPVIEGTGNEGGVTEGLFEMERSGELMVARNHAVDGHYVTGWFTDPARASASADADSVDTSRIFVREANYHPDGGQVFFPRDGAAFIALLAPPGDDVKPDDFVAFYCDGSFGIQVLPDVWHQPIYPLAPRATFEDKQGRVHACIGVDLVVEFSTYLSVPLRAI